MAVTFQGFSGAAQLVSGPITGDIPLIYAGHLGTISLTVPGATPDMHFLVSIPALAADLAVVDAVCIVSGTVILRVLNAIVDNVDPSSTTFYLLGL